MTGQLRLLHLSDLHVTDPYKSRAEVWGAVAPRLREQEPFDFIVVSGDLSQRASEDEYTELAQFVEDSLVPLLREKVQHERSRVVLIPGNHDVDWSVSVGDEVDLATLSPEDLRRIIKENRMDPTYSAYRMRVTESGRVELRRKGAHYAGRFGNVQRFLSRFYEGFMPGPNRVFDLSGLEGEDWSAHVFPQAGVAFYGFNSCWGNDGIWTGAHISPDSIAKAGNHASKYAQGLLKIAVWHHGLGSENQRPDYLPVLTLGRLHNAGFRLGMHGHTHQAAKKDLNDVLGASFAVVAAGSIGAGSPERPEAVGNQFLVGTLFVPSHGRFELFERDNAGVYTRRRVWPVTIHQPADPAPSGDFAKEHDRICRVTADGVARVDVVLRDVTIDRRLVLALLAPPFCGIDHDTEAVTDRGNIPVLRTDLHAGRVMFSVSRPGFYERLKWSYLVSNGFLLDALELEQLPAEAKRWLPNLPAEVQAWPHVVRFSTDRLTYSIRFDCGAPVIDHEHSVLAEHGRTDVTDPDYKWELDPEEQRRGVIELDAQGNSIRLILNGPLVGHRYAPAYALKRSSVSPHFQALDCAKALLASCRSNRAGGRGASQVFANGMTKLMGMLLGNLKSVTWVCFLWNDSKKVLQPAFGKFSSQMWAQEFGFGSGVAGHSLRFSSIATWHRHARDRQRTVLYQPTSLFPQHDWIVSVPIRTGKAGPAVGVLCLSGGDTHDGAAAVLSTVALNSTRESAFGAPFAEFPAGVNRTFWEICREQGLLLNRTDLAKLVQSA